MNFITNAEADIITMAEVDFTKARVAAIKLGREHGEAAGSWVTDGNTEPETYLKLQQGMQDGDPEILDMLPHSPLSGEFADSMTPNKLYAELELTELQLRNWEESTELDVLCEEYDAGVRRGSRAHSQSRLPVSAGGLTDA